MTNVTLDPELTGLESLFEYSGRSPGVARSHLIVQVTSYGAATFYGRFAGGDGTLSCANLIGNGSSLLVIASGVVYFISLERPSHFECLTYGPIREYLQAEDCDASYFATDVTIAKYKGWSRAWLSTRLSFDGIRGMGLYGSELIAEGWHAPSQDWRPIRLDAATGQVHAAAF